MRRELGRRAVSDLRHACSRAAGISSCSTATIRACGRPSDGDGTRAARRRARSARREHAMVCLHHHPVADGQPLAGHRRTRRARTTSGASSMRMPTSAPWCGGTCIRRTTGSAAVCACSRRRRPARNSCRRATATPSIRARRPIVDSSCTPDGRIDTEVHWVDSLPASRRSPLSRALMRPASTCTALPRAGPGAVRGCCSASPRAPTARCIRSGNCTANTTPSICSGSIHVLRLSDYPLAPAVLEAYGNAKSILHGSESWRRSSSEQVQAEMLASAHPARRQDAAGRPGARALWARRGAGARGGRRAVRCSISSHPGSPPRPFRRCS